MSDVIVTLAGFVGTTPRLFTSEAGNDYTSFRVAHTRRRLDREAGKWVDGPTIWFTVKAWRAVARNVAASLRKGDPVLVTGRLAVDEWNGPQGARMDLVVEATALGPDLTRGETTFRHTFRRSGADAIGSEAAGSGEREGENGEDRVGETTAAGSTASSADEPISGSSRAAGSDAEAEPGLARESLESSALDEDPWASDEAALAAAG